MSSMQCFSHMKAILDEDEFIAEAGSGGCVVSPIFWLIRSSLPRIIFHIASSSYILFNFRSSASNVQG